MTKVEPPPPGWYRPLASHLGEAYLRYGFTHGTAQEVDFLWGSLGLSQGDRLLDVGAGPGRHALEFARRGAEVVGVDISAEFVSVALRKAREEGAAVSMFEMDARDMPFEEEFDAVVSLCEGAFGLGEDDLAILRAMAAALRPGGRAAVGAPNVFYVLEHMSESGEFDPATMLFREKVEVKGARGEGRVFEMWNSCYTPRELAWIANGAGLDPHAVHGIAPGDYAERRPTRDHPELLLLADKPPRRANISK